MNGFITYVRERFPLGTYLLLTIGFAWSSHLTQVPAGGHGELRVILAATLGLLLFFFELRLMDERKDYTKDQIVNPDRPLPRGIITPDFAMKMIRVLAVLMFVYAVFLGLAFRLEAALLYAGITVYLWLMFREFFIGERLSEFPFIYAITHQAIVIPISVLGAVLTTGKWRGNALWLAVLFTSSFFSYEICRKLNPGSHPLNKTYLQYHGPRVTMLVVAALTGVSIYAGFALGLERILLPFQCLLLASLLIPIFRPLSFKLTELAATIGLVIHLWATVLEGFLR